MQIKITRWLCLLQVNRPKCD